ncbi:hypothetical protein ABEB36_001939 [Hypothenemus hampei]|uniref:Uncharacterized protein n=1 Tax=Hypothenemus hampei TaxID=57062 RepID=A0ABD1FGV6_HYPHA
MFGRGGFLVKILLLVTVTCVVLVECKREKKDVHHMIVLNDKPKSTRSSRHNHKERSKRKNKHHDSSSSEEISSYEEDFSYEERPKPPRRHQKRHKHHHHHHRNYEPNLIHDSGANWTPISSQELFGNYPSHTNHQPHMAFPQSGSIHFSQPIPIEITTPLGMPSNSFISYESTLYPPLQRDTYRPFDYSILGQNNHVNPSNNVKGVVKDKAETHTPFSIIVAEFGETGKENPNKELGKKTTKGRRGRGSSRFKLRRRELS